LRRAAATPGPSPSVMSLRGRRCCHCLDPITAARSDRARVPPRCRAHPDQGAAGPKAVARSRPAHLEATCDLRRCALPARGCPAAAVADACSVHNGVGRKQIPGNGGAVLGNGETRCGIDQWGTSRRRFFVSPHRASHPLEERDAGPFTCHAPALHCPAWKSGKTGN
jgi:hypothetical protein